LGARWQLRPGSAQPRLRLRRADDRGGARPGRAARARRRHRGARTDTRAPHAGTGRPRPQARGVPGRRTRPCTPARVDDGDLDRCLNPLLTETASARATTAATVAIVWAPTPAQVSSPVAVADDEGARQAC